MRDEQQSQIAPVDVAHETPIVQGSDNRLACSSRGDNQVAMTIMNRPFGIELFEYLGLIRLRMYL